MLQIGNVHSGIGEQSKTGSNLPPEAGFEGGRGGLKQLSARGVPKLWCTIYELLATGGSSCPRSMMHAEVAKRRGILSAENYAVLLDDTAKRVARFVLFFVGLESPCARADRDVLAPCCSLLPGRAQFPSWRVQAHDPGIHTLVAGILGQYVGIGHNCYKSLHSHQKTTAAAHKGSALPARTPYIQQLEIWKKRLDRIDGN